MKRMIDSGRKRELANDLRLQKLVNCESTGQEMVLQFNKEKKKIEKNARTSKAQVLSKWRSVINGAFDAVKWKTETFSSARRKKRYPI